MNCIARRAWSRTSPRTGTTSSAPRSAQGGEIGAAASVSPISRENAMTRNRFRLIGQVGAVLAVLLVALAAGLIAACDGGDSAVAPAPAPPPAPTPAPAPAPEPEPEPAPPPLDLAAGGVTTVPAGALIRKPANFFDLEGKTLTFSPDAAGAYTVEVGRLLWDAPGSGGAGTRSRELRDDGAAVNLPFSFPFGDRVWNRVYVNRNGNISFQRPEKGNWPHRDPWAAGGMRSVAAAIDSRSAVGMEAMIAVFWAIHDAPTISVDSSPARVVVTWRAVRRPHDYAPLGENRFQARLYPSGTVELSYRAVPERDGFVGLFHGRDAGGDILDAMDDPAGDAPGRLDITGMEMVDNGSTILARMTLSENVPQAVAEGEMTYRISLDLGGFECSVVLLVNADGRRGEKHCIPVPRVVGFRVRGATIEIWISKTLLDGVEQFAWRASTYWWGGDGSDHMSEPGRAQVDEPDRDLDATTGTVAGNLFEVFHYPVFPRTPATVLSFIYERVPPNDEIAVMFTDFRVDDLWNSGGGTGPVNAPVQGIGALQAKPNRGDRYGSDNLLTSMFPVFLGAENWTETGVGGGRAFRNAARGIRWIAHEAVHRWSSHLDFRNPRTGEIEPLWQDSCRCHWNTYLHAPAMFPVWPGYSGGSYSEASVMGGEVWVENGDGTFTRNDDGFPLPTGLSALDLYVMGMISADEVPDTFLLSDVQETNRSGTVRATKVPVRIEDVVAALGPRIPPAEESRKEFRLGIYLLHPEDRPPRTDLLARAQAVHAATVDYFARATDGRMRVVPSGSPAQAAIRTTSTARRAFPDSGGERTPLFLQCGADAHAHAPPRRPSS